MKIFFIFSLLLISCAFFKISNVYAVFDPIASPNNKFGVHILFPTEISEAARLVNSNGGDWGYVTIPIQSNDRDLEKWQKFMDDAKTYHVIPIIRIASENYYFDSKIWRKPEAYDILDFANFLNSLNFPTKNKYVVIYNEVNRGDEWQGNADPSEYAQILNYAVLTFKALDEDFFIISSGLDNASANVFKNSVNQYDFMNEMESAVPGVFGQIDGLGSHSYPNPAFSEPPLVVTPRSISSFKYERELAKRLSGKDLPVFITETGWSKEKVSDEKISSYFKSAFENIWSNESVVAVTPFLLKAGAGPFLPFSLIDSNGQPTFSYRAIESIPKTKGEPLLNPDKENKTNSKITPKSFFKKIPAQPSRDLDLFKESKNVTVFFKWFLKSLNVL